MKRSLFILTTVILLIAAAFFILGGVHLHKEEFSKLPDIGSEKDAYEIHYVELIPRETISDFAVDSGNIYVHYESSALVNVYKTDGSFEYGIQISTMQNGKGGIAVDGGKLYFCSRYPVIFVFEDGQLIETVDLWSSDESLEKDRMIRKMAEQEANHRDGENTYVLMEAENDIVIEETNAVMLDFPEISNAGDYAMMGVATIGILMLYVELFQKKRLRDGGNGPCS